MEYVPTGVEGRKSPETVYTRALLLQKHMLSDETVSLLDEGTG